MLSLSNIHSLLYSFSVCLCYCKNVCYVKYGALNNSKTVMISKVESSDIIWVFSPICMRLTRWLNILKYWNRLINLDDNRLTKKIFNWDYSLASNFNYINWSSGVRAILSSIDKECVFLTKSACDLINCEQPLKENDINKWLVDLNSKPKLRTYMLNSRPSSNLNIL